MLHPVRLATVGFLLCSRLAWAPPPCPCGPPRIAEVYPKASLGFIGELIDGTRPREGHAPATFRTIRSLKGAVPPRVVVGWYFGSRYYGGGIPFRKNAVYLVSTRPPHYHGELPWIDCYGTSA